VAAGATGFAHFAGLARHALVDGATGIALIVEGRPERTLAFTFVRDRIAVIDIVTAPEKVALLEVRLV
jgi:RNA polymerase sigma-70 factor (ECF subfamily)